MPDTAPSETPLSEYDDTAKKSVDAGIADETAAFDVAADDQPSPDEARKVDGAESAE